MMQDVKITTRTLWGFFFGGGGVIIIRSTGTKTTKDYSFLSVLKHDVYLDKNIQYCMYKFVIDDNTEETREEEKTS